MQLTPQPFKSVFPNVDLRDTAMEAEKDEEVALESELEELVHSAGTTWQDYANCHQDLATTNTIEDNWEEMLLSRAKTGDSHELDSEENNESTTDNTPAPVLSTQTASSYVLVPTKRVCYVTQQKPTKSQTNVKDIMWSQVHQAKQTKLTDLFSRDIL